MFARSSWNWKIDEKRSPVATGNPLWLVELTTGVHYYAMLCGVVNAFEVAAPPDGDKLPA